MPTVPPSPPDLGHHRLLIGLLLSLLAHALVLSIQFGLPGLRAGGGPMTVRLAPMPAPGSLPDQPLPAPAPSHAAADVPTPESARTPGSGFRLFDPVPIAPPPAPQAPAKPVRRRRSVRRALPRHDPSPTPVIVQQDNPDAAFKVPLAENEPALEPPAVKEQQADPAPAGPEPDERAAETAEAAADRAREADEEAQRLAQLREQEEERRRLADAELEQRRLAELERASIAGHERQQALEQQALQREQEQRLAAGRAAALQHEAQAERERTRQREEAARERLLASEREAEARRRLDEQLRQERDRQQGLAAEETARRVAAERELIARQLAQEAARQREVEAERQQVQQLAQQQAEDERLRRQRAEAVAAQAVQEELARQQAVQQARQQAHEAAEADRARQAAMASSPAGEGSGPATAQGSGNGSGGSLPRGTLDGASLAGRARELMRGIDLPGATPPALRPAQQMPDRRRRVVDTLERDVPLRLYVDSFRQKIERNAAQIRMQLAGGPGRSDPVVSVAVRSDGSVDDVTIVRSSGRADLDEAVRRIVHLNARYAAFPPNVAARFDVIEIRRIWMFAEGLKLLEEVR
jgi:TonB family protein